MTKVNANATILIYSAFQQVSTLCGIWCFSNPNSRSQQTKCRKRSLPQPEMILPGSLEKRTVVSSEQKQEILLHKYLEVKRNSTFFILYGFLDTTLYNQ